MNKTLTNERIEELALLNLGYDRQVRLRDFARAIEREVLATQQPEPRDAIARSKRILDLVDSYHENPTQHTRTALRAALMDEFQPEPRAEVTDAARDVLAERRRQVDDEGWTPEHDDEHNGGEMASAAASYAQRAGMHEAGAMVGPCPQPPKFWPWDNEWWKDAGARRNLVKAGALILAEIERIDRADARAGEGQ
ncbi:hypothetical protein [Burkholderia ambifaria]|uniref:hypothetical protein n=1 Tax=Burkholderia ambifaria TaxID=152480 RepID=UPI001589441B|nr:hypothetical protein [Burkholderia ambifaria]